ncbi:MAG: phytoene desaturase, partial [Clostridiales bacterium]|nr:phytoene desaturase [Clostridiales bacterium]
INLIKTPDFQFDLTASILMNPEIFTEVFDSVNRDYRDYFEFIRIDPSYRVYYDDRSSCDFSSDMVKLAETLESISKKDSLGYFNFLADVYKKYLIADKHFLQKAFRTPFDFFNPSTLINALKLKTLSNTHSFVSKYVEDERLRKFLTFLPLYVGISPFNGPNIYTLIPAVTEIYGLQHIKGGMYSYVKALQKIIYELGGTIETKTNIEEILIYDGKATGVRVGTETENGDIIICNADFPYGVKELIKDKNAKGKYTDEKLAHMKYSCSNFIIYLGLKKKYPELLVHNLYLGEDFKENIECVFNGSLPQMPSLYIYCPTRIDESMAAKDMECLNIMVRVPNLLFNNIDWDMETINIMRKRVFETLHRIKGLEDLEENIVYENYLTPMDLFNKFNSYGGTAYGLSPTLIQTNYFRPHLKFQTVKNLYFTGSSVHPGPGVSIVLISSKLVVQEILKDG